MGRLHQQGTAVIGGDVSGNARGARSVDIQAERSAVTQVTSSVDCVAIGQRNTASGYTGQGTAIGYNNVASGYNISVAIGSSNTASGQRSIAIGEDNLASGDYSIADGFSNIAGSDHSTVIGYDNTLTDSEDGTSIGSGNTNAGFRTLTAGYNNTASGYLDSIAIGSGCTASAYYSMALGYQAKARIAKTTNICGPLINRKDDGEAAGDAFESFCGVEVVLMTKEVDLKVVADHTITLPANCKFWFDEMGLIATDIDTLTVQPTIRFGITGTPAKQNAAAITTVITAAGKREIETPLVPEDGETSLVGGITVAATATTAKGRFYFRGLLVEDE